MAGLVDVHGAGEALDFAERQSQRLAEVADGAARLVGGEGGDQRRALRPVALVDPRDQLLADVPREIEIDVRDLGELLVQETAQEEVVLDRVDVREARQVADERADAGAATAPRRQQPPGGLRATHLRRHLAGELQHVLVEQEKAREPQLPDQCQLLVQAPLGLGAMRRPLVAMDQAKAAELGETTIGAPVLRAGIAVADLLREVEAQSLGEPLRLGDGLGVVAEARGGSLHREQGGGGVSAAHGLRLVQGRPEPHRHHRVLEGEGASGRVHGRRPSRPPGRRVAPPERRASGCASGRVARAAAATRSGSGPGRRRAAAAGPGRRPRPDRLAPSCRPRRRRGRNRRGRPAPRCGARARRSRSREEEDLAFPPPPWCRGGLR